MKTIHVWEKLEIVLKAENPYDNPSNDDYGLSLIEVQDVH